MLGQWPTGAATAAILAVLSSGVWAQSQPDSSTTDIGTFYKNQEGALFPKPSYSPYAGRNYPIACAVGRHPSPHRQLARRRAPSATRSGRRRLSASRAARR